MKKERGSVPTPGMSTGPGWGTRGGGKSGDAEPGGVPREAGEAARPALAAARARVRARTQAVTADPAAAHLTSPGDRRCGGGGYGARQGPGALDQVGLVSRPPRALQHTWLLPKPLPAPPCSLARSSNPQNRLPHPSDPRRSAVGVPPAGAMEKRKVGEGGETGEGEAACSAITPAAAPTAGRGWLEAAPPPRTPPPPLPQVRAKPHHHPSKALRAGKRRRARWPSRERRKRDGGGRHPGWERRGSWRLAQRPPAPLIPGQAPPRSPCPQPPTHPPLACCSLGEDDAGSARLAGLHLQVPVTP